MIEAPRSPASPDNLADALAFTLRFDGRARRRDTGEMMAAIMVRQNVEHLERAGYFVMQRPPVGGASTLGREHFKS